MVPVNNDDNNVIVDEDVLKSFKKIKNSDNFKINGTIIVPNPKDIELNEDAIKEAE